MTTPEPPASASGRPLPDAPATHRNREPIREELARWLPESARVLEIASGTGQHAVYFAERMPDSTWLPSDGNPESLDGIAAWIAVAAFSSAAALASASAAAFSAAAVSAAARPTFPRCAAWIAVAAFSSAASPVSPRNVSASALAVFSIP